MTECVGGSVVSCSGVLQAPRPVSAEEAVRIFVEFEDNDSAKRGTLCAVLVVEQTHSVFGCSCVGHARQVLWRAHCASSAV